MDKLHLKEILSIFPKYCYAFAYGSAIFSQKLKKIDVKLLSNSNDNQNNLKTNSLKDHKMIDFIIVVNNTLEWHQENLKKNNFHYSFLKYFGSNLITKVQEDYGANCYFNTLIPLENNYIKYGVINKNHLINDLLDWDNLYISGRLHKPIEIIEPNDLSKNDLNQLSTAMRINYQNAIHACLLQLSETFTEEELYLNLAGLSYNGDFRMIFGEDKNKIQNIVTNQFDLFHSIYQPYLHQLTKANLLNYDNIKKLFIKDLNPRCVLHSLNLLPKRVQQKLYLEYNKTGKLFDIDDVLLALAHSYQCSEYLKKSISDIVKYSSLTQSAKGLLTAGFLKSSKYSLLKIIKMKNSLLNKQ